MVKANGRGLNSAGMSGPALGCRQTLPTFSGPATATNAQQAPLTLRANRARRSIGWRTLHKKIISPPNTLCNSRAALMHEVA